MTTATIRPYRELLPNGEIRIHMHYGQIAVMMSKAREILALAGVQCIAAGEYVYGANGPVLVDDVQEGEEIIGGVVSNRQEYEADIYEIVFSNGIRIRLSSEHPLWHKQEVTSAPCWASVSDLYDTPLRVGKYQRAFAAKGYVKFEKATLKGIPIAHAKLLGYLTSDGCFTHGQGVKFTNTNRTFIDDVASLSIPLGVKAEAKPKGTGWDLHLTLDKGHRNPIKIYLASLGVTQTSFGDVVRADRESSIEFLRGYFNGDGYLRIERRNQKDSRLDTALIGFCTDGKTKSVEMQFILWKLGIISKIQHEWMSKGTRPFYRVTVTGKFLRILLGLLEDTKYPDQFRAALSQSLPTIDKYKEDDNGYWVGIRGVQKVGRGKVIGWTTLGNNEIVSYCGMKTHNSGKTSVGIDWIDREIRQKGEGDYLVVSATYPLMQFRLLPEFLDVFQTMQHLGKWREADKLFEFNANKTRVFFGTATNPESLESATAKAAIADEAGQSQFRREAREALLRRLSRHQGRILYPTTPYQLGWLKTELFDRAKQPESDIEVISWPSTANPVFPQAEMDRAKMVMPGWKYRMFYEGKFERPAGLIYDAFDEATCKIHRFPIPQNWLRYVGHDFGTANPAAMFYAQDPGTGYFYAYGEYKPGPGRSTREHAMEFKRLTEGVNVLKRAGGSHQEEEIRAAYTANGWFIQEPKIHDVAAGIDRVYALHKLNKLFVFDDLQKYLDEKLSYSYALDDNYEPTDEIEDKSSYHLMDAERYILSDFTPELVDGQEQFFTMKVFGGEAKRSHSHLKKAGRRW